MGKSLKILIMNFEYPPRCGGAGNATHYLLREFSKINNVEADLVTSSDNNKFEIELPWKGVRIYRLAIGKSGGHGKLWSQKEIIEYAFKSYFFAKNLIKGNKYDICHAFFTVPSGFVAFLLKNKIPYIVSLRGSDVPGYSKRFEFQYILLKPLIRTIWKNASFVIANSEGLKKLALKTSRKQKMIVIPNGVDTSTFKPHHKLPRKQVLICVSRLIRRKGIDFLIRTAKELSKMEGNFEFLIVGDGPERELLEKLVLELGLENKIKFKGRVPHDKLNRYYNKASIYLMASLSEGMSNSCLEAMASGLPIITTKMPGTDELIKGNGIIVPRDEKIMANAIFKLYSNKHKLRVMSAKSRKLAEKMRWKGVANLYLKIYQKASD